MIMRLCWSNQVNSTLESHRRSAKLSSSENIGRIIAPQNVLRSLDPLRKKPCPYSHSRSIPLNPIPRTRSRIGNSLMCWDVIIRTSLTLCFLEAIPPSRMRSPLISVVASAIESIHEYGEIPLNIFCVAPSNGIRYKELGEGIRHKCLRNGG